MTYPIWRQGDPVLVAPVIIVGPAGVATFAKPTIHPGFLSQVASAAGVQSTWREVEAWLRIGRGKLDELAEQYPEVREAFDQGAQRGRRSLQSAYEATLRRLETPQSNSKAAKRLRAQARELRRLKEAGIF